MGNECINCTISVSNFLINNSPTNYKDGLFIDDAQGSSLSICEKARERERALKKESPFQCPLRMIV